jgi:hypothetical protein
LNTWRKIAIKLLLLTVCIILWNWTQKPRSISKTLNRTFPFDCTYLQYLIKTRTLSRVEKYRNPHGQLKENLFLPLFNTNFISKSSQLPIWQHAGKGTRHFNITLRGLWFLSGCTSIAIPRQDRHSNITLKDFWFLSGFTSIALPSDTCRFRLLTTTGISHEWGKDRIVIVSKQHIRCHLWHLYSVTVNKVMVMTLKFPRWWLFLKH